MRVAILEDDRALASQLGDTLVKAGHSCRAFETGAAILTALPRDTFDLLVLDWNLPDTTGIDVLAKVRARTESATVPVIFLTSRSDGADVIQALNAGADDYVTKPFRADELLARVGALLRRSFPHRPVDRLQTGPFTFDIPRARLIVDGEELALTNKEFQLALLLLSNPNRILSREYLLATIWNTTQDLQSRTLDVHISHVRVKLRLRPETGYRLVSLYNHGYRLETMGDAVGSGDADRV